MRVLALGSDRNVLNPKSESAQRQMRYGEKLGELDIIVFTLRHEPLSPQTLAPGVHAYPTASSSRLLYGFSAIRMAWKMPRPDVITVQDPFEAGLLGVILSIILRAPLHVQIHTDFLSPYFSPVSLFNRIRVAIAGAALNRATRIRVVSERIRRSLQDAYPIRGSVSVLPIYTDIERFKGATPKVERAAEFAKFGRKLLVVSRLEREKNVELAIEAFAKAVSPDTCLIIVGDGRERRALENLAVRRGQSLHVFFEGQQDPAPYYALADLVLVPSWYEGYGNVIIEALAAGKPVLATDVGIAEEAGAIVTRPDTYTTALIEWLKSGPREGKLEYQPYQSFDEYVQAYCDDIAACALKR